MSSLSPIPPSSVNSESASENPKLARSWWTRDLSEAPSPIYQLGAALREQVPLSLPPCSDEEEERLVYLDSEKCSILSYGRLSDRSNATLNFLFSESEREKIDTDQQEVIVTFCRNGSLLGSFLGTLTSTLKQVRAELPRYLRRFSRETGMQPSLADISPPSNDVQPILESTYLYETANAVGIDLKSVLEEVRGSRHEIEESTRYRNPIYQLWNYWRTWRRLSGWLYRDAAAKICWAVPSPDVLRAMVARCPRILELGAGTGFWARCLTAAGAKVTAVDDNSDRNSLMGKFFPVEGREAVTFLRENRGVFDDHALFFCWGRSSQVLAECVRAWNGEWIFFIGEGADGCTASLSDYMAVEGEREGWVEHEHSAEVPRWEGISDALIIYRRDPEIRRQRFVQQRKAAKAYRQAAEWANLRMAELFAN